MSVREVKTLLYRRGIDTVTADGLAMTAYYHGAAYCPAFTLRYAAGRYELEEN